MREWGVKCPSIKTQPGTVNNYFFFLSIARWQTSRKRTNCLEWSLIHREAGCFCQTVDNINLDFKGGQSFLINDMVIFHFSFFRFFRSKNLNGRYLTNQIRWIFFFLYIFVRFVRILQFLLKYSMNNNYVICMIYFMNNNDVCIEKFSGFGSNKKKR